MGYLFDISVLSSEKNMQPHTLCLHAVHKSTKLTNKLNYDKENNFHITG
jgi:hypothetical protein